MHSRTCSHEAALVPAPPSPPAVARPKKIPKLHGSGWIPYQRNEMKAYAQVAPAADRSGKTGKLLRDAIVRKQRMLAVAWDAMGEERRREFSEQFRKEQRDHATAIVAAQSIENKWLNYKCIAASNFGCGSLTSPAAQSLIGQFFKDGGKLPSKKERELDSISTFQIIQFTHQICSLSSKMA